MRKLIVATGRGANGKLSRAIVGTLDTNSVWLPSALAAVLAGREHKGIALALVPAIRRERARVTLPKRCYVWAHTGQGPVLVARGRAAYDWVCGAIEDALRDAGSSLSVSDRQGRAPRG